MNLLITLIEVDELSRRMLELIHGCELVYNVDTDEPELD